MSGVLAACGTLLLGCTDGSGGGHGGRSPSAGATAPPAASGSAASAGAPPGATASAGSTAGTRSAGSAPKTTAEAEKLIAKVIPGPELYGTGVRRAAPYERDPSRVAVLGKDCLWRLEPLPGDVLASRTRRFEVPASAGRGPVRLTATVTVHRSALAASWRQAGMLQEALACEEQTQREGERLTGLSSLSLAYGEGNNVNADDSLLETGSCVSDTDGGPYPYWWQQMQLGPVVTSTSVCGGRGWTEAELTALFDRVLPTMLVRVQEEVGPPGGSGSGGADTSPGPSGTAATTPGVKDATGKPTTTAAPGTPDVKEGP